jgi:hypothetical protein
MLPRLCSRVRLIPQPHFQHIVHALGCRCRCDTTAEVFTGICPRESLQYSSYVILDMFRDPVSTHSLNLEQCLFYHLFVGQNMPRYRIGYSERHVRILQPHFRCEIRSKSRPSTDQMPANVQHRDWYHLPPQGEIWMCSVNLNHFQIDGGTLRGSPA